MKGFMAILILVAVFCPGIAYAKRAAPSKVEPVTSEGVRYVAPNDEGLHGYVQAWDAKTGKMLWQATVFRTSIDPRVEEDVQDVYIKKMSLGKGTLFLVLEDEREYGLDLKTRAIKRLDLAPWRGRHFWLGQEWF
jgi:hypothetical protein